MFSLIFLDDILLTENTKNTNRSTPHYSVVYILIGLKSPFTQIAFKDNFLCTYHHLNVFCVNQSVQKIFD
jgi:hypothetical protein